MLGWTECKILERQETGIHVQAVQIGPRAGAHPCNGSHTGGIIPDTAAHLNLFPSVLLALNIAESCCQIARPVFTISHDIEGPKESRLTPTQMLRLIKPAIGETPVPRVLAAFPPSFAGKDWEVHDPLRSHWSISCNGEYTIHGFRPGYLDRKLWLASFVSMRENSYVYGLAAMCTPIIWWHRQG